MSGRSAHVRKKQGPKELNKRPVVVNSVYDAANSMPSFGKWTSSKNTPKVNLPPAYSSTSAVSTSSSGSGGNPASKTTSHSSHSGPQYVQSAIEKSSFRAFMDQKSDKVREKLSFKFAGPGSSLKPDDRSYRPPSSLTTHTEDAVFEMASNSVATARARMVRSPDGLGMQYDQAPSGRTSRAQRSHEEYSARRFLGGGQKPHAWNKMRRDPELWDPSGDTLVFFGHETQLASRPPASFRIRSSMLEETQSAFLITILREGYVYNSDFNLPPSPTSAYPPSQESSEEFQYATHGQAINRPRGHAQEAPAVYEVYFPAPLNQSKQESLRHHMTTRNVFSLLMNKSLVGFTFGQALMDLHERLEMYMPPDCDVTGMIIEYLTSKHLDDMRNDPATAAGFLAWCESPLVRWQEGWIEAFVHCSGMHSTLKQLPEWREVSYVSRQLIDRASLDLQVRIRDVEERLVSFNFADMWPMTSAIQPAARTSFERCQKFLIKFYETVYWSWPPPLAGEGENWLTRDLALRLQSDFGALYDYLVDRDVLWDESEERSTRKWKIVSRTQDSFRADSDDLPITDILVAFDNRHRFPHIPHPFPLLPESHPVPAQQKQSLFQKKQKTPEDRAAERRAALAYSNATNINMLGSGVASNRFVEAFINFEKTDRPSESDPYDARRGRWILLYGLLQVLATVSVDTPGVRWVEDLTYFINPRLRGVPPWQSAGDPPVEEASHLQSHCWQASKSWGKSRDSSNDELRQEPRAEPRFEPRSDSIPRELPAREAFREDTGRDFRERGLLIQRKVTLHQTSEIHSDGGGGLLAGSESDDVATTTTSNIGGQRARDWVNSGGGFSGPTDTVAIKSQKEKVREWPIQSVRGQERSKGTSAKATSTSSYRPPSDW